MPITNKEFVKFSPTNILREEALNLDLFAPLSSVMADLMTEALGVPVGVYGAEVNSSDTGAYVLGYYAD